MTTSSSRFQYIFLIVALIAVILIAFLGYNYKNSQGGYDNQSGVPSTQEPDASIQPSEQPSDEETVCTLEAKICPDGSAVGRKGPNCDFQECPTQGD